MTPELIAAVVAVLLAIANFIKQHTDQQKIKMQRSETAVKRDSDSLELHDAVKHNSWEIEQLKTNAGHTAQTLEQLRSEVSDLNKNLALTTQCLEQLTEAIKDLKAQQQ